MSGDLSVSEPGTGTGTRGGPGWRPGSALAALHLAVLAQLAVSQPVFDLLERHPAFLVAHHTRRLDLLIFVAVVAALVPALLALPPVLVARRWPALGGALFTLLLIALVTVIALPPAIRVPALPAVGQLAIAALAGLLAAFLYRRYAAVRSVLTVLAPALLIFPAVFLFSEHVRPIAFPPAFDAARAGAVAGDAPVVMVVFDELPLPTLLDADGDIDGRRFPAFARLAATSRFFRRATTVADSTSFAVPSLLAGTYPDRDRAPTAAGYPHNLFTMLAGHHRFEVFETLTALCPPAACPDRAGGGDEGIEDVGERLRSLLLDTGLVFVHSVLPAAWTGDLPPVSGRWRRFHEDEVTADQVELFRAFLATLGGARERTLYFLHTVLPHSPWRYLPSGRTYRCAGRRVPGLEAGRWRDDDALRLEGFRRHLLQAAFADRLLGELLDVLERTGMDRRALLIVTADHGLGFVPGEHWRLVAPETARSIASVPLFVRAPGVAPAAVDRPVELIDVLPTVVDVLGVEPPAAWSSPGRSLLAEDPPPREALVVYKTSYRLGQRFTFEPDALHEADEGIRELSRALSSAPESLFRPRRHRPWIGRPSAALRPLLAPGARARFEGRAARAADEGGAIPVCVAGRVHAPEGGGDALGIAIAVDGEVRALTRTFGDARGALRFHALVPGAPARGRLEALVLAADALPPPLPTPAADRLRR